MNQEPRPPGSCFQTKPLDKNEPGTPSYTRVQVDFKGHISYYINMLCEQKGNPAAGG